MSYPLARFLTLIVILALVSTTHLLAQRNDVKRELSELSSPAAWKRAAAVSRIAAIQGDIGADLRVAYGIADLQERLGLFEAAQLRNDPALVTQAAKALSDSDERASGTAHEYLMSLSFKELDLDTDSFSDAETNAWDSFVSFRIRHDIATALLEAHLMPGKYFGQFEALRSFDSGRIDEELLLLLKADETFSVPLTSAAHSAIEADGPPERMFLGAFRRLNVAVEGFALVLTYSRSMTMTDELRATIERTPRATYQAAFEVYGNVRAAAVRALAGSPDSLALRDSLAQYYGVLGSHTPAPEIEHLLNIEATLVEIEVTLARLGDATLLDARIATLRSQIERVQQLKANVNMKAGSRPDLIAQNEIAHLQLRSGNLEGAEREWSSAADDAVILQRTAEGRNRSSLSSYLAAVYYNLACAQSLQLKSSKALASLKKAVRHGYKDFSWMLEDGDLYEVRQHESFATWFNDMAPPSVADRLRADR